MSDAAGLFADGDGYERLMGRWSRLAGDEFLDWLCAPKNLRWLDVGCGNGAFTEGLIAKCVPNEIIAIDPSGEQLAYGCARPGARLAQFRQGDAAKLPFPDDSFDSATMALVISFLSDPALAVAEMARVVRPGGWVSTYMWDIPGGGAPTAPIELAMKSLGLTRGAPPDSAVSRRESLFGLWEKAGLVSISTRVINVPITYSNFEDFWDTNNVRIGPVGKMIDEMPPDLRERLRARLRQHLPADSSGRICYEARANAVKGKVPL